MRGGDLVREARLRAGLTQAELSERSGTQRSVIARWEQGTVSPTFDNMLEVIEASGFELPLMLIPRDASLDQQLDKNRRLSPERRAQRLLAKLDREQPDRNRSFDPYRLLQVLDQHRVTYIVIGGFARVIQGTEELTRSVDIVPSTRPENLLRLDAAVRDLGAETEGREPTIDESTIKAEQVLALSTEHGELKIIPNPVGTRGYDDLRRAANREPLGRGIRPWVASVGDLARMISALSEQERIPQVMQLRRLVELERVRERVIQR